MPARFLNVDLEIWSASRLDSIALEMGDRVFVLHCGPAPRRQLLAVEIALSRRRRNPDWTIHALCDLVESLSAASQRLLKKARLVFDAGYELDPVKRTGQLSLTPETLARISNLGATLAITYYGQLQPFSQPNPSGRLGAKRKTTLSAR